MAAPGKILIKPARKRKPEHVAVDQKRRVRLPIGVSHVVPIDYAGNAGDAD